MTVILVVLLLVMSGALAISSVCDLDPCICNSTTLELTCTCNTDFKGMVTGELPDYVQEIQVFGCNLTVKSEALVKMPNLRKVELRGIAVLNLEPFAFKLADKTKVSIEVTDSFIPLLPQFTFTGLTRDISIRETVIGKTQSFAFTGLERLRKLDFHRIHIDSLPSHTITNVTTDYFFFVGNVIESIEAEAVELDVRHNARLIENDIDSLHAKSITLGSIKKVFQFNENSVEEAHPEAISVQVTNAIVESNLFSNLYSNAFSGVHCSFLSFEKNKFNKLQKGSFNFNSQRVSFTNFTFKRPCTCTPGSWVSDYMPIFKKLYPKDNTSAIYSKVSCLSDESEIVNADEASTQPFCEASNAQLLSPTALYALIISAVVLLFLLSVVAVTIISKKREEVRMKRNNSLLQHQARSSDLGTFPLERRF